VETQVVETVSGTSSNLPVQIVAGVAAAALVAGTIYVGHKYLKARKEAKESEIIEATEPPAAVKVQTS
jgi:hypothetical protein